MYGIQFNIVQEYWSELPFPAPGNLSNPGIKIASPASPALAGGSLPLRRLGSPYNVMVSYKCTLWNDHHNQAN